MPRKKQILTRVKLQSHQSPRGYNDYVVVPELRMTGKWLRSVGLSIGSRVEVQEHPEGLLIKKIVE